MSQISKAIRGCFWSFYLRLRGAKVGRRIKVGGPFNILLRDGALFRNLSIGDDVQFDGKTYIRMRKNGRISIGRNARIGTETWLVAANEKEFKIGNNAILGSYSIFNGGHGLTIGADCIFAAYVYINTSDHGIKKNQLIQKQEYLGAPIEIGEDVWLGGQVFINKGTIIGRGAVIGAGSVVTKNVPAYSIAVGNPARIIGERD